MKKLIIFYLLFILLPTQLFSQGAGASYCKAAQEARKTAERTSCLETKNYCYALAKYMDCWCENTKAGSTPRDCGQQPNAPAPCEADQMESNEGNTGGYSSSKNSNSIKDLQQKQQQMQLDFTNAQTAADNAYQAAISSGKKSSGAMLERNLGWSNSNK